LHIDWLLPYTRKWKIKIYVLGSLRRDRELLYKVLIYNVDMCIILAILYKHTEEKLMIFTDHLLAMIGKFRLEMGQTCNLGVGNKCIDNFGLHVAWKAAT
jgi:hypothetical protein